MTAIPSTAARRVPATAVWLLAIGGRGVPRLLDPAPLRQAPPARPRRVGGGVDHRPRILPARAARGLRPRPPPRAGALATAPAHRPRLRVARRRPHPPAGRDAPVRGGAGRRAPGGVAPRHPRGGGRPRLRRDRPRHPPRLFVARALGPPPAARTRTSSTRPRTWAPWAPSSPIPSCWSRCSPPPASASRTPARSRSSSPPSSCSASPRPPSAPAPPRAPSSAPRRGRGRCWPSPQCPRPASSR